MAKKKKGRQQDARGYGQSSTPSPSLQQQPSLASVAASRQVQLQQQQQQRSKNTSTTIATLAATATAIPTSKNKIVQVSSKTHDGLLQLLGQLSEQQQEEDEETITTITKACVIDRTTPKFATKLASICYILENEFKFSMIHIEQVVKALHYNLNSIEIALDWLCLHLQSYELPTLFTEYQVRDKQLEHDQQQENSLTVIKFNNYNKSITTTTSTIDEGVLEEATVESPTNNILQQPNLDDVEQSMKSKEEQEEKEARKAWLLAQYQYEEDDDDDDDDDDDNDNYTNDNGGIVNDKQHQNQQDVDQKGQNQKLSQNSMSTTTSMSTEPLLLTTTANSTTTTTTTTTAEATAAEATTTTTTSLVDISPPPPSPQELQLVELECELNESQIDLNNEANNYMRSKQETKELANHVKKLKQQINGVRKKIEKQKQQQQQQGAATKEQQQNPSVAVVVDVEEEDDEGYGIGSLFSTNDKKEEQYNDEEEEYGSGAGLFSMSTNSAKGKNDPETTTKSSTGDNTGNEATATSPLPENVDYSIPKGWTGTTPQKTLNEWYQKRQKGKSGKKLPKPKYYKLPGGSSSGGGPSNKKQQGYRLVIVTEKGVSHEFQQEQNHSTKFHGDVQEYLAIQALYALEPTLPLYQLFPPVFRALWLSWVDEVQQEVHRQKQDYVSVQTKKIDRLLALAEESFSKAQKKYNDERASSSSSSSLLTRNNKQGTNSTTTTNTQMTESELLLDSWEDMDISHGENPATTQTTKMDSHPPTASSPTTKGARLRDEFVRRQSTSAYEDMKQIRRTLPMHAFRQTVLDTIQNHPVTILCAETGAGKTTQCPQYCLEDALLNGNGDRINMICTQPRRVAATSVAERVAEEMCEPRGVGSLVGYQIRMEAKKSASTKLLFCTTGVILRRLQGDSTLKGVTHVLVDEVHERQQQTDVLLIALRRLLKTTRPDLKVILMSATLDSKLFCSFFDGAPLLSVPGRTFPVSSYYLEDLMDATDHLIEEGSRYAIREDRYGGSKATLWVTNRGGEKHKEVVDLVSQVDVGDVSDNYPGYKMSTRRSMDRVNEEAINYDLIEDVLNLLLVRPERNSSLIAPEGADLSRGSVLVFLPGLGEIRSMTERLEASRTLGNTNRFQVIPMHSTLSSRDQRKAFIPAKSGCRKLILSTNIAETSVTIPDVVAVIDTGRVREVRQNKRTSTSTLVTDWCSQASAKQRSGRAGRVQPGICLKLYSSQTASATMKPASEPELRRVPLEEICLSILASGMATSDSGGCLGFLSQAPQPPAETSIEAALKVLLEVGAISIPEKVAGSRSNNSKASSGERLTPLGHHLSKLPVDVRLGKMLIFGSLFHCIDRVLTVAACLSSDSLFSTFVGADGNVAQAKQKAFADPQSDFMTLCNVWEAYVDVVTSSGENGGRKFCRSNYLNQNALREIRNARLQFLDLLCGIGFLDRSVIMGSSSVGQSKDGGYDKKWDGAALLSSIYNANGDKSDVVHAVICAGLYPNVAHLVSPSVSSASELWYKKERLYVHSTSVNVKMTKQPSSATTAIIQQQRSSWISFHEKFGTSHRVSISTTCFVHPFAILLFGGTIDVKHVDRKVIVDDWIEIGLAAQTGVMMRELRHQVNRLLHEMIGSVNSDQDHQSQQILSRNEQKSTMVDGIVQLLLS